MTSIASPQTARVFDQFHGGSHLVVNAASVPIADVFRFLFGVAAELADHHMRTSNDWFWHNPST
jgi:hypothetical protein